MTIGNLQHSDWTIENDSSIKNSSIMMIRNDESREYDIEKRNGFDLSLCCKGLILGVLFGFVLLAIAIPLLLTSLKTNNTSTLTSTTTTTATTSTTTGPPCVPFWKMPSTDQGTYLTYSNANTQINGDVSRSGCVSVRASSSNLDNIVFAIGSTEITASGGCNRHFALAIINANHVTIYGMCASYDNVDIPLSQSILHDGNFHQLCVTYDTNTVYLCVYLDLLSPVCLTRTNPRYNTGLGDVRIGWWPDGNRQFDASGGGLIRALSLFSTAINQTCVNYLYQTNISSG